MKTKKLTLVLIYDSEKILLGMKKRGFGVGKWNGFGGKVEKGEGVLESAERELFEECTVKIKSRDSLVRRGVISFRFEDNLEKILEVNYFSVDSNKVIGTPKETEEMKPKWFKLNKIPYDKMWLDDVDWMPLLLMGKNFKGDYLYSEDGSKILQKKLEIVRDLI